MLPDGNENRPPRINQCSFGFQQEITRNFIMEASYVGNHAVWLGSGPLGTIGGTGVNSSGSSNLAADVCAAYGLYPYPGTGPCSSGGVCASSSYNNYADYLLTLQPLNSAAVQQQAGPVWARGFTPYAGFPATDRCRAALYPFPQFGALEDSNSPTGDSKYDSLQIKATKRFSHGLQAGGTYTWGQGFVRPSRQDFFNPQSARVGAAADPDSGSELQRHLHRAQGGVHAQSICNGSPRIGRSAGSPITRAARS